MPNTPTTTENTQEKLNPLACPACKGKGYQFNEEEWCSQCKGSGKADFATLMTAIQSAGCAYADSLATEEEPLPPGLAFNRSLMATAWSTGYAQALIDSHEYAKRKIEPAATSRAAASSDAA